ncbi:Imidazole glycerol phosphate synthase subunit HisH 1 [Polystyrenella longa]|uniref:Imidazole glycerol phosphate synthase subunit HisH n=1 Tax=Polystyrenella longa TaxID=2528007 RepID=A0A518CK22_9PLAN|nr:imidazole glycerol phosphate synthase subunit HisH [Polystyrenella longa]QDU79579.1 Imidazole glycerol phosphate synthase subunit HisH 1 [Polystyrenella longa]
MIKIVDYGMGNLRSVQKAFEKIGAEVEICGRAEEISSADKLVLPGVGAFRDAIAELGKQEMIDPIKQHIAANKPFLGICLGLQLLFEKSYEGGEFEGLSVLPGEVVRFPDEPGYKIPHMGWNDLELTPTENPLLKGIPADAHFYFVHSYYVAPAEESDIATRTEYIRPFCSMVHRGNLFATQFHPEKSQLVGLKLLENFNNL